MIKRITFFIGILIICFGMIPMECKAANVDLGRRCSLTISYTRSGEIFSDLDIEIYRVAELRDTGMYYLLQPFSNYPINIYGITSQRVWQDVAQTIRSYVEADQIAAYQSQKTDSSGQAFFENLETGLYMVKGITAQSEERVVTFYDFMVYLPTPVDHDFDYDVEVKPKSTEHQKPAKYTVVKLWKDAEVSDQRPTSVSVDILKDGVVWKNVILDSTNNWSYSWEVSEQNGTWSVMEKNVADGYRVSITNSETMFIITNSKEKDPEDPPKDPSKDPDSSDHTSTGVKTGDTVPFFMYVIILCVAGFGLMILGILKLREKNDEEKR